MTEVRRAAIERLREMFAGDVILPSDAGYDDARRVWNGMIDKRPALVVRPLTPTDVAVAVRFGREQDLLIAVRGGGHSLPGLSTCDDGVVIDLSRMRGATVDPASRTARVNGGALLRELDEAAQARGLVCPVGVVGHTGVAGLTLGGGMGRLQRRFGLTLDNLRAVELVTADGRPVRASATDNPDLFWGVRGAGANFGVVTAFEFQLHPLDAMVTRGSFVYPAERTAEVWATYRDFSASAPDHLHIAFNLALAGAADHPPSVAGQPIVTIGYLHSGDPDRAAEETAALRAAGTPVAESIFHEPYLAVQGMFDEALMWGQRNYSKGTFVDDLPADAWQRLVGHAANGFASSTFGAWAQGGAMGRVGDDETAFTGRGARFDVAADTSWTDPAQDEAQIGWVRDAMAIVEPHAVLGAYVNETSESGDEVVRSIYGTAKLERLVALKRAWDPDNVFRLNQNIKP